MDTKALVEALIQWKVDNPIQFPGCTPAQGDFRTIAVHELVDILIEYFNSQE